MDLRANAISGQERRRMEDSAYALRRRQVCRRRTISWDVADHGEVAGWPIRPTTGVGRSDNHESVRLRGAAHAPGSARPVAVPSLALPARPALVGASAPVQLLVRLRSCAPDPDAAGSTPAAAALRGDR